MVMHGIGISEVSRDWRGFSQWWGEGQKRMNLLEVIPNLKKQTKIFKEHDYVDKYTYVLVRILGCINMG